MLDFTKEVLIFRVYVQNIKISQSKLGGVMKWKASCPMLTEIKYVDFIMGC
jgi:hypothetical protein